MQKIILKSSLRAALIYDLCAGLRCYVRQHVTRCTVSHNLKHLSTHQAQVAAG